VGDAAFGQLVPCETCGEVHLRRIAQFDRHSSRRGRALRQDFKNFCLDGAAAAAVDAYNAAVGFAQAPAGWLVIYGPKGNGKSHLAAAIANHLIKKQRTATLFLTVPDLLQGLREEVKVSMQGEAARPALLQAAQEAPVLIVDDLGAERCTPWAEEQLFLLFDFRYRLELPTVAITNEALDALPARIYSRLGDRRLGQVVHNPAPDYRWGDGRVTV
jgi:DNA replication protein DnaC